MHALVGENGAGKTTLMRILAGIYQEYEGSYLLDGEAQHLRSPKVALQKGIGMIHQELSILPELSVAENLFLGRQPRSRWGLVDWKRMRAIAREELAEAGFEDVRVRRPLGSYPLGIQQVVELLGVIHSGARILIMDEPTSALSPAEVERLIQLIKTLRDQDRSIVFISHFLEDVLQVADRITVLRDGRSVATVNRDETTIDALISLILGREIDARLPDALPQTEASVLLQVEDLSADTFRNVSFSIRRGEIVGLYGPVGAGHFDVARALFGRYRTDLGTITLDGTTLPSNFATSAAVRGGLAYATESRRKSLFLNNAVFQNVTLPHLRRITGYAPNRSRELTVARAAMSRVNVQPSDPMNTAGNLSGGNQQKVAIARWLTYPPKVFIVSEPTRGMDVGAKHDVLKILRNLRNEGFGVLVVSSEPETVLAVADRVLTFSRGQVKAQLDNAGLKKDTLLRLI